ncbi:MAG TPA: replication-associated recombination protein A, partial [Actinobacteria bacterium]|nr:replication-associated recombination protein A [Actinomycetota bacterium]
FASEDIGLADRHALPIAIAASQALAYTGLPEATYALTHAALYLATAVKSNTVAVSIRKARDAVEETAGADVPVHLRSAAYAGAKELGHGVGYRYPHDYEEHVVAQQYLPDEAVGRALFTPVDQGDEAGIRERVASWRRFLRGR